MKIPLKYNLRSLWVRRVGTLMTALGVGLTVSVVITMMALVHGLEATFTETGRDSQYIVIRKGSQNETNSYFTRDLFETVRFLPGVSRNAENQPLAAGEIVVVINHPRLTGESSNVMMRGISDLSYELRPEAKIVAGRRIRKGVREILASRSLSERFQDLALGDTISVSGNDWRVVGIFDTGGSAYDSEIWGDYNEIAQVWNRPIYTSILLRASDAATGESLQKRINDDQRIQLQAIPQKQYFRDQAMTSIAIKGLGFFIAMVMGIGSCFAAMNMMYGTILARFPEIGTLRALGFRRRSILASFLVESIVLALLGGALGCLIALPIHGISTGTSNFFTFSEILFNFRITPRILMWGMIFAATVGLLGGMLPAFRAARIRLVEVMRQ